MGAAAYAVWQTLGTGRILYGDCLVIINSISNVTYGILDFAGNFTDLADASLYLQNIRDFLAMPVQITERADALPVRRGNLEFCNVTFTYPGAAKPTIQNLSFTLADGEKLALVGQNGAGKTTIAKLALRLYDPDDGEILYGGVNIKDLRLADYRAAFAVVFQDFRNFAVSVAENVLLHPEAPGERETVLDALDKSGFSEKLKRLPDGADTRLTREFDEQGVNLSGGEGQKLSIARIYAKQADIAILDEPTSALDPLAEYKMYENMMDACRDRSVLFISHRLSSAVLADRVLLLEDGSVAESGTHAALMAADGAYAAMFRMQAEKYRESEDVCHG
jgi:ATP-binding cassette subfamily B protein